MPDVTPTYDLDVARELLRRLQPYEEACPQPACRIDRRPRVMVHQSAEDVAIWLAEALFDRDHLCAHDGIEDASDCPRAVHVAEPMCEHGYKPGECPFPL